MTLKGLSGMYYRVVNALCNEMLPYPKWPLYTFLWRGWLRRKWAKNLMNYNIVGWVIYFTVTQVWKQN